MAGAEIVTDGTVGVKPFRDNPVALTGPIMNIPGELGTKSGPNLFHSFSTFNVPGGSTARFMPNSDAGTISRVIARVTGPNQSRIDGVVRTNDIPGADLYLINPNGFVFGPAASINVDGSFYASTANSVGFPDGRSFSARPTGDAGLSMAAPESFGFVGAPVTIAVNGGGFNAGRDTVLVGGHVTVSGNRSATLAGYGTRLSSSNGNLRLVAAGTSRTVPIAGPVATPGSYDGSLAILDGATLTAGRGSIWLEAGSVTLDAATAEVRSTPEGTSGGIAVSADSVHLLKTGNRIGALLSTTDGSYSSGPIEVTAGSLLIDGGRISAEALGTSTAPAGGAIRLRLERELRLSGTGTVTTSSYGISDAGDVEVYAGSVILEGRSGLGGLAWSSGRGANVTVSARDRVLISAEPTDTAAAEFPPGIFTLARDGSRGNGGNVRVQAPLVSLDRFGQISNGSLGLGAGGSLTVEGETIALSGRSSINSSAGSKAARGGSVLVQGGSLYLAGGSEITVSSLSQGVAGDLIFSLAGSLVAADSTLNASAKNAAGGNVILQVGSLMRLVRGTVTASAGGAGGGGNIAIDGHSVVLDRSRLSADAVAGNGGAVAIGSTTYHASADSLVTVSSTFGFSGTVRLDTPTFGRTSPSGQDGRSKLELLPARLTDCDRGGRLEGILTQESFRVIKPLGEVPTNFFLPGERSRPAGAGRTRC